VDRSIVLSAAPVRLAALRHGVRDDAFERFFF
jgi:hypothetical protein